MAPEALDHHGAGDGQVAVDVAQGDMKAVLVAFVGLVPFGVEGLHPRVAVDGAQAHKPGGEVSDLVIAVAAAHGLVGDDQFVGAGGFPPGQQGHGFTFVAGIDRAEKGQGLEEQGAGRGGAVRRTSGSWGSSQGMPWAGTAAVKKGVLFTRKRPSLVRR